MSWFEVIQKKTSVFKVILSFVRNKTLLLRWCPVLEYPYVCKEGCASSMGIGYVLRVWCHVLNKEGYRSSVTIVLNYSHTKWWLLDFNYSWITLIERRKDDSSVTQIHIFLRESVVRYKMPEFCHILAVLMYIQKQLLISIHKLSAGKFTIKKYIHFITTHGVNFNTPHK